MEKHEETRYVKRTQKDYSMSFKLQIVQEIERGQLTVTESKNLWHSK
jgi:transposase-like protein